MPTKPLHFSLSQIGTRSPDNDTVRANSNRSGGMDVSVVDRSSRVRSNCVIGCPPDARPPSEGRFGMPLSCVTNRANSVSDSFFMRTIDRVDSSNYTAARRVSYPGEGPVRCSSERIPFSSESPRAGSSPLESPSTQWHADALEVSGEDPIESQRDIPHDAFLADGMPQGRFILLNLLTTWGDMHEVGLNGVEIFDENGKRIIPLPDDVEDEPKQQENFWQQQQHQQYQGVSVEEILLGEERRGAAGSYTTLTYAAPNGRLRVIVEHPNVRGMTVTIVSTTTSTGVDRRAMHREGCDISTTDSEVEPRHRVENIVNGLHNTHDDSKLFTMPFTPDGHHFIGFVLPEPVVISMVRVHNYGGRGRVHTSKGTRLLEMKVDGKLVFRGTISPNCGEVVQPHRVGLENCENILFTEDEKVLRWIVENSATVSRASVKSDSWSLRRTSTVEAPPHNGLCMETTTVLFIPEKEDRAQQFGSEKGVVVPAAFPLNAPAIQAVPSTFRPPSAAPASTAAAEPSACPSRCSGSSTSRCLTNVTSACLMLLSTWGDTETMGLSGLRFRDEHGCLVNHCITQWFVRFPSSKKMRYSDEGDADCDAWESRLIYLFDEDPDTSMTLPCERGIEIIFIFETPLPTLGFVEVANYSIGEHTFCGVKEARLFISSAVPCATASSLLAAYEGLWDPDSSLTRTVLAANGIFEVTPEEGVCLRKAPAFLSIPRFQIYDLSPANWDPSAIASGNGAFRVSRSQSLSASMTIRTEMALRRARMTLRPRPEWLLDYQPYFTPLLPVAYVLKVNLLICARGSRELKNYAKKWMMKPMRACKFADENGKRIRVHGSKRKTFGNKSSEGNGGSSSSSALGSGEASNYFVAECLFTPLPSAVQQDAEVAAIAAQTGVHSSLLHASLCLVYVADSPFCVSVVSLCCPLVSEGCMAWVKQVRILMDDALVFDSGEVGVPHLATQTPTPQYSALASVGEDQPTLATRGGNAHKAERNAAEQQPSSVAYTTRLKPLVFFTLDASVLDETRKELALF